MRKVAKYCRNKQSNENQAEFQWGKKFRKIKNNCTKCHYPAPPIASWACISVEIDAIGMEMAQKMKLSGCLAKGHSSVKSGINTFLSIKKPVESTLYQLSQYLQICML